MNLKTEYKKLDKYYWKNNQVFCITTPSDWYWQPKRRWDVDVVLTDKEGKEWRNFLFTIRTLNSFVDLEYKPCKFYYKKSKMYDKNILLESSYTPFYINNTFTIKEFRNITKEDLYNCMNYFIHKVLGMWFKNIKVVIPKKE